MECREDDFYPMQKSLSATHVFNFILNRKIRVVGPVTHIEFKSQHSQSFHFTDSLGLRHYNGSEVENITVTQSLISGVNKGSLHPVDFHTLADGRYILLMQRAHCLHIRNAGLDDSVSQHVGDCIRSGHTDGDFSQARFILITQIISSSQQQLFTLESNWRLRLVDFDLNMVSTKGFPLTTSTLTRFTQKVHLGEMSQLQRTTYLHDNTTSITLRDATIFISSQDMQEEVCLSSACAVNFLCAPSDITSFVINKGRWLIGLDSLIIDMYGKSFV